MLAVTPAEKAAKQQRALAALVALPLQVLLIQWAYNYAVEGTTIPPLGYLRTAVIVFGIAALYRVVTFDTDKSKKGLE